VKKEIMQILRLLLTLCLLVGVTSVLSSCAPKPPKETTTPTVEESTGVGGTEETEKAEGTAAESEEVGTSAETPAKEMK